MTKFFPESFEPTTTTLKSPESGSLAPPTSVFALHHKAKNGEAVSKTGNVLVLLHGYPQNHTLWRETVVELQKAGVLDNWDVIIPDLPGYGKSTKEPSPDGSHAAHSKRAIGGDILAVVNELVGSETKFVVVGHDRGARIAFRLAQDFPERLKGASVLDIVPTKDVFFKMRYEEGMHRETIRTYHWIFLALPPPLPDTLIANSYEFYFTHTINSWTGTRWKGKYDKAALDSWVQQYSDPAVITGVLEDYRAGATIDLVHDEENEKEGTAAVQVPLLSLYSKYLKNRFNDVDDIYRNLAKGPFRTKQVGDDETGHFIPIEAAEETTKEIIDWLKSLH
ncbi:alpha/beta-hydrolase [Meredithblackwellia eburnea MCA 4105]